MREENSHKSLSWCFERGIPDPTSEVNGYVFGFHRVETHRHRLPFGVFVDPAKPAEHGGQGGTILQTEKEVMKGENNRFEQKDQNRTMKTPSLVLKRLQWYLRKNSMDGKTVYLRTRDAESHRIGLVRFEQKEQNRTIRRVCSYSEKSAKVFKKEGPEDAKWYICAEQIQKHHRPTRTYFEQK